jgi:hypothetical protein
MNLKSLYIKLVKIPFHLENQEKVENSVRLKQLFYLNGFQSPKHHSHMEI